MIAYALRRKRDGKWWDPWMGWFRDGLSADCIATDGWWKAKRGQEVVRVSVNMRVLGPVKEAKR